MNSFTLKAKLSVTGVVLLILALCTPAQAEKPVVVTTIAQIADVVSHITGDKMEVSSLMGEGVDPHTYRMNRKDIAALTRADIILYNGLYLEAQMEDALERMAQNKPVVPLAAAIDQTLLLSSQSYENKHDPHVWMDVQKWMAVTRKALEVIIAFDPGNQAFYTENATAYLAQLEQLNSYVTRVLASVPENERVVISAHDAFNYFGQAYDFEVIGIQGLSTASEAGLKKIEELVALIVERKIKAVFVESSVADRNVRALIEGAAARGHPVQIGGTLFSDAMGPLGSYEGTYIGMLDHNATVISRALGGNATTSGMQEMLTLSQNTPN
ncbi:zinc ABC transporter substrate-binding protein [Kiloniella laminariae]|uniref:Zinc ABC transporter substrate-binding protein n=1 Tax=Kiloniella laminariae TaxID=454162 RepID=A0ABT4LNB3_9PROT|nr:zinc ABC transporter substrate-binding protein [Kiloniella laminariae]MCZ4282375.1 zinc ABC transporter substrate-binding protein [Kiloniella laminariae]